MTTDIPIEDTTMLETSESILSSSAASSPLSDPPSSPDLSDVSSDTSITEQTDLGRYGEPLVAVDILPIPSCAPGQSLEKNTTPGANKEEKAKSKALREAQKELKAQEKAKKAEEKERVKKEREEKRERMKKEKEEEKVRKREEREVMLRKKREEKEKREADIADRRAAKEAELQEKRAAKEAERAAKEAERLAREEAKEEAKRAKDEAERAKELSQKRIKNFFIPQVKPSKSLESSQEIPMSDFERHFLPFHVKPNVHLPSRPYRSLTSIHTILDPLLSSSSPSSCPHIPDQIHVWRMKGASMQGEEQKKEEDSEVICTGTSSRASSQRIVFHHFAENTRPAYFGTWSSQSRVIRGRRPFSRDDSLLNYEVDSEAEWEEEGEGEDCDSEDDEEEDEEEEEGDHLEVRNRARMKRLVSSMEEDGEEEEEGWVVPHGYLSDDEAPTPSTPSSTLTTRRAPLETLVPRVIGILQPGLHPLEDGKESEGEGILEEMRIRPSWSITFPLALPSKEFKEKLCSPKKDSSSQIITSVDVPMSDRCQQRSLDLASTSSPNDPDCMEVEVNTQAKTPTLSPALLSSLLEKVNGSSQSLIKLLERLSPFYPGIPDKVLEEAILAHASRERLNPFTPDKVWRVKSRVS
ncbi:MAG: chromatin assembly factor 1 subunit A-domain-containing protein [Piptocephalis tieghemiana]|nr:MAG: chromatin assembly factor 1 subunit A-domain-containing protein [Piptocephalis tieghemiana]